jgi:hypothetical protein
MTICREGQRPRGKFMRASKTGVLQPVVCTLSVVTYFLVDQLILL